ncbi:unnamed protein product [Adineta steineri]|uniref:RING-type domain-containing protein n=1 Tax=Adineta steineri TaxID=433720 RepID=A0A819RSE2_9BILA|nr:unnamed protein product [Adineta steineri]CAF4052651.1 unnamed protein product [Adineta steineri]
MGRRRRKNAKKQALCSVCQNSYVSSSSFLTRCSTCTTMSRHTLCDGCFYKHIFTTISNDITSRVICPEPMCDTELNKEIIQSAFHAFGNQPLWEDYVSRSNWHGKSNQWIKKFSVRCPDCRVPIEKNGGCDRMTCTQCLLCFSWERAKFSNWIRIPIMWRKNKAKIAMTFYICLIIIFMLFFVKFLLFRMKDLI